MPKRKPLFDRIGIGFGELRNHPDLTPKLKRLVRTLQRDVQQLERESRRIVVTTEKGIPEVVYCFSEAQWNDFQTSYQKGFDLRCICEGGVEITRTITIHTKEHG